MPQQFFPTKEDFQQAVDESFEKIISDKLEALVKRATAKEIYTINEVCDLLDCSRRHLMYLRSSGQINYIKNGKKVYFRHEDLLDFFDRNYIENEEVN
jgi:excisionase family DNA binding protein